MEQPASANDSFAEKLLRTERLAEQLSDALERIDYRIAGRSSARLSGTDTSVPGLPRTQPSPEPPLEHTASVAIMVLERCIELAQRIGGDVGAQDVVSATAGSMLGAPVLRREEYPMKRPV